jgi:hypothetical protein
MNRILLLWYKFNYNKMIVIVSGLFIWGIFYHTLGSPLVLVPSLNIDIKFPGHDLKDTGIKFAFNVHNTVNIFVRRPQCIDLGMRIGCAYKQNFIGACTSKMSVYMTIKCLKSQKTRLCRCSLKCGGIGYKLRTSICS